MAGAASCLVSDASAKALTGEASHDHGSAHGATTPLFLTQCLAIPATGRQSPMAPTKQCQSLARSPDVVSTAGGAWDRHQAEPGAPVQPPDHRATVGAGETQPDALVLMPPLLPRRHTLPPDLELLRESPSLTSPSAVTLLLISRYMLTKLGTLNL